MAYGSVKVDSIVTSTKTVSVDNLLESATASTTYAPKASPTFTGTVTIPAGASISGFAPLASPTFTGTPTVPGYLTTATAASTYAPLASPSLTGVPVAPTAAVDTNTTQLATTAYVLAQASATTPVINGTATIGTSTRFARADHIHPTDTTRAPLASPTFTGTVTIPAGASITGYLTTATAASTYAALATAQTFTAAQRGTVSAIGAVAAGTTTLDFATANNFSLTLPAGGTVSLGNPTNQTAGQSGVITITQNGTTAAVVTYGGNWKFQSGAPSVSTTLSSVNVIAYYVESATRITAQLLTNTIS